MLVHIHETVVPKPYPKPALVEADDTPQTDFTLKQSQAPTNAAYHNVPPVSAATSAESPSLTVSDLNPPVVQKVVVEHLVHTSDFAISGNSPSPLRAFSGRTPHPPIEVASTELLFQDPMVSDFCRVCEGLLSPVADIVKSLSPTASPSACIQLLDSAFAPIKDGDE